MYAVIKTGGKQYRVSVGDTLSVDKIEVEGSELEFNEVLLVANGEDIKIGAPLVAGAKVKATLIEQYRGEKVRIIKFRRRKHHKKQAGHRSYLTKVQINSIEA